MQAASNLTPWPQLLLRRAAALMADCGAACSLSLVAMLALNAMGVLQMPFLWIIPLSAVVLVVLRTFGLSMGNTTFSLSVQPASLGKNALRAVALVIPGVNLFDWCYALFDEQHRTWVDKRLGMRVVDASFPFGR